ncbi:pupal cuticle protein C1B-like [Agrilus planipennis]|uniref:Pupal cuticle protein C1B-like n=1 Tax=Agrilus planipennis TaxID=224129 RepID=A0A1W4WYX4_AGRPL|nr:pupal cuticle protein C1B-like [Agrilus planipennis]
MSFRIFILCVSLAVAHAGAPATYAPGPTVSTAPALAYSAAPSISHITYSSPVVSYNIPFSTQAITSQSSNIHRSFGNLGQVSTYSKTIDTPFSSVSKADVRVSNPGVHLASVQPAVYGPPPPSVAYAAHPAPVAYAAHPTPVAYAAHPTPVAYAAHPTPVAYAAHPAPVAYATHSAPVAYATHSAPVAYAAQPTPFAYSAGAAQYATGAITSQSSNIHRSFGNLGQVSTYTKTIDTPFSSVSKADVRVSNPSVKFAAAAAPLAYAAPAAPVAYAAPAVHAAPGPLLGVAYSAAPAVAHVTYAANFGSYEW